MEQETRLRLVRKYNNYFSHWRDFYVMIALLVLIQMGVQMSLWENGFK